MGEGYCRGSLKNAPDLPFHCGELDHNPDVVEERADADAGERDEFGEQWLYLRCSEGYNVFVSDGDLLATPRVKEGKIINYGQVGPADDH